jgi:hypothetical protein
MTSSMWLLGLGWPGEGLGLPAFQPTPLDGLLTAALMLAFYAFGDWAHRRRSGLDRKTVVPFEEPAPASSHHSTRSR